MGPTYTPSRRGGRACGGAMTSESMRVLFTDLGYTVYQVVPNLPVGAAMAIDVIAEPTEHPPGVAQRFRRRVVGSPASPPTPGTSLETVAERYLRRLVDLVVHDGLRVQAEGERSAEVVLT